MFETILDEEERGQVGIGTLIVFIAMVLVAAIAAGVLINTAGFLQTQAEATGEESTSQVSDRLQIVSTSGDVDSNQNIENVSFIVATSPGSGAIDLNQTTVEFVGEQGQDRFEVDYSEVGEGIVGTDGGVLTDNSDRAELKFQLTTPNVTSGFNEYNSQPLAEDETVTVTFTTSSGASTVKEIRVPTTITSDDSSVRL
ncbi:flagellin [Halorubrum sp. BOL3-1]|uniref:archaellin/type IV pilin N-terminal domain-containing protein n=1 Tax=Halorubrum sp. BOL3-1 TaxID=2497325 RepID=UPI001004D854|nr:archaellin/type IV pilin N-terminal domain-containing protein [Halorubrum sp. BOL3-1]QAU13479.1 flagellin [Halorubrum sp. BOL3-1]